MRYQPRSFRSQSYLANYNKQNKENQNNLNIKQNRPIKLKRSQTYLPKLNAKISDTETDISSMKALLKDQSEPVDIKNQYSKQIGKEYSTIILAHLCDQSMHSKKFLDNHNITEGLRSKMIDWMIQVLSTYKMSEDSFFRSAKIMDSFLKKCLNKLQIKDLHLIGVASMFTACKYEQIYPMKLEVIYDKIARKKFKKSQILQKQSQILCVLDFRIEEVNLYDIAKNLSFEIDLEIGQDQKNYLNSIITYLSKMSLFSYELAQEDTKLLAAGVYFIALKTLEQVQANIMCEQRLGQISNLLNCSQDKIIEVSRQILQLAKNFTSIHPNLGNLKKFNKFQYKKKRNSKL